MTNIRTEYVKYEKALRDLLNIAPDLIRAKQTLFDKYGPKSELKLSKKGKPTQYTTLYNRYSVGICNIYTDELVLELTQDDDEEAHDLFPEFEECMFSPGNPVFLTLNDGRKTLKESFITYDAKTKTLMDIESGYKTDLKSLEDCKGALFQMGVITEVTTTPEELWLMVSVLNDWYKVKSLRNMFIYIKPDCIKKETLINNMVIPE
ncbi:hypothetical protein FOI42_RS03480 [Escherichia coli]|nr:hypothetical protein [Escherichia coli]MED6699371.1 hypothetical protein [Escherichia coli O157]USL83465.1 hypothetical protein A4_389 [Escherichia phage A4]